MPTQFAVNIENHWLNARVRRSRVVSPKELRQFAEECFGWAESARNDNERRIFLEMATIWLQAAVTAERHEVDRGPGDERTTR